MAGFEVIPEVVRSRGSDVLEETLGFDFPGLLGRDGWAPYAKLALATAQSCLAHFFVRSRELIETSLRGAARFPHAVIEILRDALALRDRRQEVSPHGLAVARGRIEARMDRLLAWRPTHAPNARFRNHLARERSHVFTFLYRPEIEATNWKAEHAMRPLTVIRKNCGGGNRTARGARTSETLLSIVRTCEQRAKSALSFFSAALKMPVPTAFALVPSAVR